MLDVTAPENVEIQIKGDGKVIWIDVNGICVFRACRIGELTLNADEYLKNLFAKI